MGKVTKAAARCCLGFTLLLSTVAAVVVLVGLSGAQSACTDEFDRVFAWAGAEGALGASEPEAQPPAESAPGRGSSGGGSSGYAAGGDYGGEEYEESEYGLDYGEEGGGAAAEAAAAVATDWAAAAQAANISELQQVPDLLANLSTLVANSTHSRLEGLLARIRNATNARLTKLLANSSHGFLGCAQRYSLHWWGWACQLLVIALSCAALCTRMCGSSAVALPALLFTATVAVLDTIICNRLFDTVSFSFYSYGGYGGAYADQVDSQQLWAGVALAGFIMAAIANYCLLLFCGPALAGRGSEGAGKAKGKDEERRALATAADS